ncbi:MAG: RecQ family ATP-dependent DNA helicase [Desulfopila sp.]
MKEPMTTSIDPEITAFLDRCLLVDIETNEHNVIYSLGAVLGEETFHSPAGRPVDRQTLAEFDRFGRDARFLLGHNILDHDIPRLGTVAADLALFAKPAIDTLYLSPLAYPANPYHRLVKDYQLVRDSVSDPVADARLAGRVFAEQWQAFAAQLALSSDIPMLYRGFLEADRQLQGTAAALAAMGTPLLEGEDLAEAFAWFARKHACGTAVDELVERLHDGTADFEPVLLAYVVAWLSVAGGNSVLPPWVRHRYPHVAVLLHLLRENGCTAADCSYCLEQHSPRTFLNRFFGFADFRPQPATEAGGSLQGEVVVAGARGSTIFATLPTGAGKSLCYQVPALMRYQRRNLLTIVISPLQALMKDQVDNFASQTGTRLAAALSGMLTMPERGEVLEGVRLGDIGILYVSPEQLRNRSFIETIRQREVGAWVFDEAHCLSKWGHDFRPDYFYAIRFIREFAADTRAQIPPLQCFTATAKKDVQAEIVDIIQRELGLRVVTFAGGHQRDNLHYQAFSVSRHEKYQVILELLRTRFTGKGGVVIYCATKRNTEKLAEFLQDNGYSAEFFHAGLEVPRKKRILTQFIAGDIPIICATNAFGMGIDKDDVRLVLHADIPGSLENYLQEAGRAGRDRQDAECILVFDERDIEKQFQLSAMSRLTRREIVSMLRGIRRASQGKPELVLTPGELLRRDDVDIDPDALHDGDSRVRTAVAWLERAGFLLRNENRTNVFQGKVLVPDMAEAARKVTGLNLSRRQRQRWLDILQALMGRTGSATGFSADELASISSFATSAEDSRFETETQRVLHTLHDMAEQGLIAKEMSLSAYLRYKVSNNASLRLQEICRLEREFLTVLQELAPDVEVDQRLELDLRQVNQRLVDRGCTDSTPHCLKSLLYGLGRDGKGLAGRAGSLGLSAQGGNCFAVYLRRDWPTIAATMRIRQQVAEIALRVILAQVKPGEAPNASLLVEFTLEQIVAGLQGDLLLFPTLRKPLAAAERALTFMHELQVLELQQGLAVFRQALTLQLLPGNGGRRYSAADFSPLKTHYTERNFQIHVMNEYARQALEKLGNASRLVASYFNDDKEAFVKRYFPGRKKMLERATSEQSYSRIVDELNNTAQAAIVRAPVDTNILVLAGPGSGKTRVVTHRVAYLLRVERVDPAAILVLCFNRGAIVSLRRKLQELVGADMTRVTTLTFHGLALRLTGRSLAVSTTRQASGEIDFTRVITDAIDLLKGESGAIGIDSESARELLVGRFSHILVDEYQDIDEEQYELVSLLAGRTIADQDQRPALLAVGDDDQNIYRFRGANVGFIRRFHQDYQAQTHYLIEDYRSTANIIAAANQLIGRNTDRMKTAYPIRVNEARRSLAAGGNWQQGDALARGRVQVLEVAEARGQALGLLAELRRLQGLKSGFDLNSCAVLAREWQELEGVRAVLEAAGLPVNLHWGRGGGFPGLQWIRENRLVLDVLRQRKNSSLSGAEMLALLPADGSQDNLWQANLRRLLVDWRTETGDTLQPVPLIEEYLYEAFADQRRARNLGNGVFLSTIHSVKGLEFDHVFLLGENWHKDLGGVVEEARRLYYVAMTRARETLQLFRLDGHVNPHLEAMDGDWAFQRRLASVADTGTTERRHVLLGMEDLYLDFAGMRRAEHPMRRALAHLDTGDRLRFVAVHDHLDLLDTTGVAVARLSRSACQRWWPLLARVEDVRVIAMVRRLRSLVEEKYQSRCHGEMWEVPIVEVRYRPG